MAAVQGPKSAQQLQPDTTLKGGGQLTGQQMMNKTVKLINSAAGAPTNQNFLDNASLDALMLAVMSERAEILEETLREQVQEVRNKNDKLKQANSIMAKARAAKKDSKESRKTPMPQDVKDFFAENNISWGSGGEKIDPSQTHQLNAGQWDLAIENMKGWTESLTSSSQLDMTKLQSTSGKFNQTFEMMSQFVSKYYRSGDNVIKNI
ncbi:hypothetical protein [Sansalvadorimonas verongulae]|uniref:hypothetical protein n=1 Tax=Sansalvadorimonas verongulae TaxID=2172824 RepID=UPI0012BC65DF|nr:hypothetical protein [Sansalvadorimonas verongulae]MTI14148.1 hypothetical protein [Sansalvadorimonas verongulae]